MQQVYGNVTKVLIDGRGNSNLLYLPLDKLMQQAGGIAAAPVPAPAPVPETTASPAGADSRSRDNQRSRDRESR